MPKWTQAGDLTTQQLPNLGGRGSQAYRVSNAVNTYIQGIALSLVAVDSQILPDFQTVAPTPAAANDTKFVGVVAPDWNGFDNAGTLNTSFISVATQLNVRGTQFIQATVKGLAYVWLDQSAGVTVTDGIPLTSSANTAGYAQGVAKASAVPNIFGWANLPAAGIGSSLTQAALAQATVTYTIGGAPAVGDVISATIQIPYTDLQPGTVQTTTISTAPLTVAQATSTTTAATAFAAALNASPYFAVQSIFGVGNPTPYFVATSAAAVVTVTVNALANPFLVTGGSTSAAGTALEQWRFFTHISGMVANTLTTTAGYTQAAGSTGTNTAGAATFTGGTGYKGKVPIIVLGQY